MCIRDRLHGIDVPMVYHDNSLLRDVLDYTEEDQFDVVLMNPPYGGHEKTEVKNHLDVYKRQLPHLPQSLKSRSQ